MTINGDLNFIQFPHNLQENPKKHLPSIATDIPKVIVYIKHPISRAIVMSKAKAALGVLFAVGFGVVNGVAVFDPAFRELKEEKERKFKNLHDANKEEDMRNLSEADVPGSQSRMNTEHDRRNDESKILNGIHAKSSEQRHKGAEGKKGSWWNGMSIWAREEKSEGRDAMAQSNAGREQEEGKNGTR